jgi:hypothetical protein
MGQQHMQGRRKFFGLRHHAAARHAGGAQGFDARDRGAGAYCLSGSISLRDIEGGVRRRAADLLHRGSKENGSTRQRVMAQGPPLDRGRNDRRLRSLPHRPCAAVNKDRMAAVGTRAHLMSGTVASAHSGRFKAADYARRSLHRWFPLHPARRATGSARDEGGT